MTEAVKTFYSRENQQTAYKRFLAEFDGYDKNRIDKQRKSEYERLDRLNHIYLDYTGGGIYSETQVEEHMEMLRSGVYGNPHSSNPTSLAMTKLDEHAREFVLEFFNASPDEYICVFTQNASGALKHVGESYPFAPGGQYLLTFDNHNSVNGIREFAKSRCATVTYSPILPPDMRIDEDQLLQLLKNADPIANNLFAYPAQSNFSGVQHDLKWIDIAHERGWDVVLDAAAFAPTNRLDLSVVKPDFVTLSFYKIFGYPTGVGALLARKDVIGKMRRPWFAGGTIEVASVQANSHYLADDEAAFEDGTIDYLNLPAVEIGLRYLDSIGINNIHNHVEALTGWLLRQVMSLKHSNGKPLFRVYGPTTTEMRGGTIACNLYDPDENIFDFRIVEKLANEFNISLRTGCFCNPGAGEMALSIPVDELKALFANNLRMTFEQFVEAMTEEGTQAAGAVRISVGIATNFADIYHFMTFAETFIDHKAEEFEAEVRAGC